MPPDRDYFANHARARRFPWSLYHGPLEASLSRFLAEVAATADEPQVLVIGCGLMQELDRAPAGMRFVIADIDARAVDAVLRRNDARIIAGHVVEPEAPPRAVGGPFHAIYAKEVIEHILAWRHYLNGLRELLVPGGRLWLSTPNYGEIWLPLLERTALELVARRSGFTRRGIHPSRFSRRALQRALRDAGFESAEATVVSRRLALVGTGTRAQMVGQRR